MEEDDISRKLVAEKAGVASGRDEINFDEVRNKMGKYLHRVNLSFPVTLTYIF